MANISESSRPMDARAPGGQYSIQGNLNFDYGLPADSLTVRLYNVGFAGKDGKLGETKSDGNGHYFIGYNPPEGLANIELRVLNTQDKEVPVSRIKYQAQKEETLNLTGG